MNQSLKVCKIHGVDFKLHFSLIFLLFYVTFVSSIQFPSIVSQAGLRLEDLRMGAWPSGLLFAFGLFFSIALHEMGHVLVAQAQGIEVKGITLMMLGGVSEMGAPSERPYSEFKLAVVGPLVSFGIWGLLGWVRWLSVSPELSLFAFWIGSINLMLGIFNLLPAFPLDGGRALRSVLAVRYGNLKATQMAVGTGKVMAWVFGLVGFLNFNVILVLIALFVYSASQSELLMLFTRGALQGIEVNEAMSPIASISGLATLGEAAAFMYRIRAQMIPVEVDSEKAGLLTLDLLQQFPKDSWSEVFVKDVIDGVPHVLGVHDSAAQAMMEVATSPLRALPVRDGDRVVGILRYSDLTELVRFKSLEKPREEQQPNENKAA